MVKKILNVLHREISGLHEAAYLLAFFALMSQLLGLVRDRLLAHMFGASQALDIYYAAFRIPDLIFVSVASLVSISVLVPFFIENMSKDEREGKRFMDSVFTVFCTLVIVACAIAYFLVPKLVPSLLPGFTDPGAIDEVISLTRILLLSPIFLGLSNFFASITQMHNRFFIYAISPLLYNLGIIVGIVLLYPMFGLKGIVWGVVLGALMHLAVQIPFVAEKRMMPRFRTMIDWNAARRVVMLSLPRTLTLSANQISSFFLVSLASLMSAGSIAVFSFSYNLQSVPLSLVGVSYSSAAFPTLARLFSAGERGKFLDQMIIGARHIIFWSMPIMILFVVLRAQIVRTILGSGAFTWADTRLTAASLAMFTISVVPQSLAVLFIRGYYSGGKTRMPLLISVGSAVLTAVLGYALIKFFSFNMFFRDFIAALFKVANVDGNMVLMLPLAFSIGSCVNLLFLWLAFHREFPAFTRPVLTTFLQTLSASVIMGYVAYKFLAVFDDVFDINTLPGIFFQGLFAGIFGIAAGVVVLKLIKNVEIREIGRALHSKIWKVKVVPAEQTEL